jgi:hypothetical protein
MGSNELGDNALSRSEEERISQAVDAITASRALIEQTKGMLMFVYGIDADAASTCCAGNLNSTTSKSASSPNRY